MITEAVKAAIGLEFAGPPELIEMKAIRDYATAINWPDPPDPLHIDENYAGKTGYGGIVAPWSFFTSLSKEDVRARLPLPRPRVGMNGGVEFEYFKPIRPGDVITTRHKVVDIVEREGKAGKLVFITVQRTFTDKAGEVMGIARHTTINQY